MDRDGLVETCLNYLRDHNLPVTQQRIDIARVLLGSDRHQSVEEPAGELRQDSWNHEPMALARVTVRLGHCASCRSGAAIN